MPAEKTKHSLAPARLDTSADPVLGLVLEATSTGLWTWDVGSDLVRWSPETYRIHALAPGEFGGSGEAFFRLVHPDDRVRVETVVRAAVRDRRPYSEEFRIVGPDGSIRWVTNRGRATYDAAGACAAVLGTITDITEYARPALDPLAGAATARGAVVTSEAVAAGAQTGPESTTHAVERVAQSVFDAQIFRSLVENNPFGVYVVDADFRLAHASKGSQQVFENVRPLLGRDFAEVLRTIWPEPAATSFIERFRHTLATGEPYEAPATVERRCDIGATEAYDWRIERIGLPTGRHGVVCYFYDLSERQHYEAKLRESESTLRLALDAAGMSLWRADLRSGSFEPSPGAAALHGEAWSGTWTLDRAGAAIVPEDREAIRQALQHIAMHGGSYELEYRSKWPDGSLHRIATAARAVLDDAGSPTGSVIGTVRDVTSRRAAEADRERNRALLEASEARLRAATDAARLGIHEFYPASGTIHWDARARDLWGVAADLPITYQVFLAAIHPDDRATVQRSVDTALDPDGNGRYEAEYRVRNAVDGIERWVYATGHVTFENRTPVRLLGTVQDVTVQKEAQARLLHADRQKDVFLATLSHELRNPLAPIRTAAHVLANGKLQPDQLSWAQSLIQRQVAHMARLLDDLMDVSRITQGKLTLKREPVRLASVVNAAAETAQALMDRKQHRLSVTLPESDIVLDADPVRLAQILSNLLTNAAKYTDPGGHVQLVAYRAGDIVEIVVRDNGIGLTAESLKSLFQMFTQADGTHVRAEGGLGIGLALVKGLVELHGGTIEARSDGSGTGSAFTVRLPPAAPASQAAGVEATGRPNAPVRRVLIADDNRDGADVLAMALGLAGHQVRVAYDGCSALAAAREFLPDVALLDVAMPGLDGHALARALRAESCGRDILLCALTGWGQDQDRLRALEAGFDHHFTKPIDMDAVEALLSEGAGRVRAADGLG
jgi:PAS domain S-box-containing protein